MTFELLAANAVFARFSSRANWETALTAIELLEGVNNKTTPRPKTFHNAFLPKIEGAGPSIQTYDLNAAPKGSPRNNIGVVPCVVAVVMATEGTRIAVTEAHLRRYQAAIRALIDPKFSLGAAFGPELAAGIKCWWTGSDRTFPLEQVADTKMARAVGLEVHVSGC